MRRSPITLWVLLFLTFQIGDAISTMYAVYTLRFQELNPVMALALEAHPGVFLAVKGLGSALVCLIALRNAHDRTVLRFMQGCTLLMALVVLWNLAGVMLHVT